MVISPWAADLKRRAGPRGAGQVREPDMDPTQISAQSKPYALWNAPPARSSHLYKQLRPSPKLLCGIRPVLSRCARAWCASILMTIDVALTEASHTRRRRPHSVRHSLICLPDQIRTELPFSTPVLRREFSSQRIDAVGVIELAHICSLLVSGCHCADPADETHPKLPCT